MTARGLIESWEVRRSGSFVSFELGELFSLELRRAMHLSEQIPPTSAKALLSNK
jgi:hypothetical protein